LLSFDHACGEETSDVTPTFFHSVSACRAGTTQNKEKSNNNNNNNNISQAKVCD